MDEKEKIIRLHEKFGLDVQPVNTQIIMDCANAIQGLEEAVHNLGVIWTIHDEDTAKRALIKELAVVSSNAAIMLNRYLPEALQPEAAHEATLDNFIPDNIPDTPF